MSVKEEGKKEEEEKEEEEEENISIGYEREVQASSGIPPSLLHVQGLAPQAPTAAEDCVRGRGGVAPSCPLAYQNLPGSTLESNQKMTVRNGRTRRRNIAIPSVRLVKPYGRDTPNKSNAKHEVI